MHKERTIVLLGFIFAVAFRLWFITLVPQPFIFDQQEYENYAYKIYHSPDWLAAHSYRSYPEPLLMAATYKIFGFGNHQALYVVHAVLDALTAVMVFVILKRAAKNHYVAWLGFALYAVNPFTSGYVGVGLSEILDTFFITATLYFGSMYVAKPRLIPAVLFGFSAGMAAETRNAAFIWAGVPIALSLIWVNWRTHVIVYAGVALGLIFTTLYPLYTNWIAYHEISITKVDSFYAMELFNGATLKILPPFTYVYPKAQQDMWYEYWSEYYPKRTTLERRAMALKYYRKAWDIIKSNPIDYIRWRFFKMWYVWQKEALFFYSDPGWMSRRMYVYGGNIVLLIFAVTGMIFGRLVTKAREGKWVWAALTGSIGYGIIAFSFSHAEYRLSIPFYPVIISLAALGVSSLLTFWRGEKIGKNRQDAQR